MSTGNILRLGRRAASAARGGLLAAALSVPLLAGTAAHARPEPIPPPPGTPPPQGASPATGQPAPADPGDPPIIPPPEGLACIEGPDQSVCDPGHPGGAKGELPSNTPPSPWFDDMASWMFGLQESLDDLSDFGQQHSPLIDYYATWLMSVTQQYYALAFLPEAVPRSYPFGTMTRGDFNYYYYYWVRPIYYSLLYYAAGFYEAHVGGHYVPTYVSLLSSVSWNYHALVRCNYGLDGDDKGAREDLAVRELEASAGLDG